MNFNISFVGHVAVIKVFGNLIGGFETSVLHSKVKELVADDICHFVIDLEHVKWINSIAVGVFLGCYTTLSRENGTIRLVNVSDKIQHVLEKTHLTPFLRIYPTVRAALDPFIKMPDPGHQEVSFLPLAASKNFKHSVY